MKLSILICSLYERKKQLASLISKFQDQALQAWSYEIQNNKGNTIERYTFTDFEIIVLTDGAIMKVGNKRNMLKSWAKGDYVCYFDDDDEPSKDYVHSILEATESGADVITFKAIHYENGRKVFNVDFGDHGHDHEIDNVAYRLPNHLCAWKREHTKRTAFPNINFGEDGAWARKMNRWIKKTHKIDKVLYHYWFSHTGTRTQQARFK